MVSRRFECWSLSCYGGTYHNINTFTHEVVSLIRLALMESTLHAVKIFAMAWGEKRHYLNANAFLLSLITMELPDQNSSFFKCNVWDLEEFMHRRTKNIIRCWQNTQCTILYPTKWKQTSLTETAVIILFNFILGGSQLMILIMNSVSKVTFLANGIPFIVGEDISNQLMNY